MKLRTVVSLFSIVGLIGCSTGPNPHERHVVQVMDETIAMMEQKPTTPEGRMALARNQLSHRAAWTPIIHDQDFNYRTDTQTRALSFMREESNSAASNMFEAGAQYTSMGRPAEAKQVYQDIIRTFSGSSFAGYRDRAKMELDALKK